MIRDLSVVLCGVTVAVLRVGEDLIAPKDVLGDVPFWKNVVFVEFVLS